MENRIEELTLLLLYLTSWEEEISNDVTIRRGWKGFRFETLDALEQAGYLNQTRRSKSVTLTGVGIERAKMLAAKYLRDTIEEKDER